MLPPHANTHANAWLLNALWFSILLLPTSIYLLTSRASDANATLPTEERMQETLIPHIQFNASKSDEAVISDILIESKTNSNISLKDYIDLYINATTTMHPNLTLWQTWFRHTLPGTQELHWQNISSRNPEYTRRVLNDTDISRYVSQYCHGSYSDIFHAVNPDLKAMKADLWRYCALYTNGGVYMDADTGVNLNMPFREWVGRNVVLSQEGNNWHAMTKSCTDIWKAAEIDFPTKVMTPNSLVQWAMIFPLPKHPILKEAMDLTTNLINYWEDKADNRWSTHDRIVCLSGPAVLAVATHRAYEASGHSWDRLMATMENGIDYNKKLFYKSKHLGGSFYNKKKPHYNRFGPSTPIKISK